MTDKRRKQAKRRAAATKAVPKGLVARVSEVARAADKATTPSGLRLGDFDVPRFDGVATVFGADMRQYPAYDAIPEPFRRGNTTFNRAVSALFFKGGKLADHGLSLKPGVDSSLAHAAIKAWLCSFAPPHEHKEATVAWALSEWCTSAPASVSA